LPQPPEGERLMRSLQHMEAHPQVEEYKLLHQHLEAFGKAMRTAISSRRRDFN
jgi:hypothetical protein